MRSSGRSGGSARTTPRRGEDGGHGIMGEKDERERECGWRRGGGERKRRARRAGEKGEGVSEGGWGGWANLPWDPRALRQEMSREKLRAMDPGAAAGHRSERPGRRCCGRRQATYHRLGTASTHRGDRRPAGHNQNGSTFIYDIAVSPRARLIRVVMAMVNTSMN